MTFVIGDVVYLKSDRVPMVVRWVGRDGHIWCDWLDVEAHIQLCSFPPECLATTPITLQEDDEDKASWGSAVWEDGT